MRLSKAFLGKIDTPVIRKYLLRKLLMLIKEGIGPAWFSIIIDEATDVAQMNLSICWVNDDYEVHEDCVGMFNVPDTKADTLFKDLLVRCTSIMSRASIRWSCEYAGQKKGSGNTDKT